MISSKVLQIFLLVSIQSAFSIRIDNDSHMSATDPSRVMYFKSRIGSQSPRDVLLPGNPIFGEALFPISPANIETPVFTRMLLTSLASFWHVNAACHPTALSILGTKDDISTTLCTEDNRALLGALTMYHVLKAEYPAEAMSFANLLKAFGADVGAMSEDVSSLAGWARVHSKRMVRFFTTDGWNSLGTATRSTFRQPFADTTSYRPRNNPYDRPTKLSYPLRWQPITFDADGHGKFRTPVHVSPHIGFTVTPFLLNREQYNSRRAPSPYMYPNKQNSIMSRDKIRAQYWINRVLHISKGLTYSKRVLAQWWDTKLFSAGQFSLMYKSKMKMSTFDFYRVLMGEVLAEHDAILLAWREKVRHDLIRPTTLIRNLRHNKMGRTYIDSANGVRNVNLSEWESVVKVMPHSEYPSGSSALCTALFDHLDIALKDVAASSGTGMVPPPQLTIVQPLVPGFKLRGPFPVKFSSFKRAAKSCGRSRLWAGVHFPPAIGAGERLVSGLGVKAFYYMKNLTSGVKPMHCNRCGMF